MEHTYGDFMNKSNEVPFILISEEIADTGAGRSIILNPFTQLYKSPPLNYKCAITFGLKVENEHLESLLFLIKDPEGNVIYSYDIKENHVDYGGFVDKLDNRHKVDIIGEVGFSINEGLDLVIAGRYSMIILYNDIEIGSSFFIVGESEVQVNEG